MISAIHSFIRAHKYCAALEQVLGQAVAGNERDALREELLAAYDDLEKKTQALVRARFAQNPNKETN